MRNSFSLRAYVGHILSALILFCSFAATPHLARAQTTENLEPVFLIAFQDETTEEEKLAALAMLGLTPQRWLTHANVVQATLQQQGAVFASHALEAVAPYVAYIEPDVVVTGALTPNDPAFNIQGDVYGQTIIEALQGWNIHTGGADGIIAVLDTGINLNHPEFAGRILPGYDFINDDADPIDDHGHGTHVAGIAAAALNNGAGAAGVCPQCTILPVKVLDSGNKGTWGTVAAGIYYAVDQGARVINLSLGATASSKTLERAIQYAEEHDVIVVAAAGNAASETPFYPAALPYVIAVGATTAQDVLWPLSNTGEHIDLTAPGHRIYSTFRNPEYAYMSGTSMATPFVSGLAGLLVSFNPAWTRDEIFQLMTANADDLGAPGKDAQYGFGRINVHRTLVAANGGVDAPEPAAPPTDEAEPPATPEPFDATTPVYLPLITQG
ncbi:MAG: S8 family peptidase [Caldilinea sp.]|uniref:S8 family peptidase n=1 Tax=Caldilinea sp. TaxID=2293560 RepID=UPI0030AF0F36